MPNLPTLYKRTSTGAIQSWRIDVEDSTIIATYGRHGGKQMQTRDVVTEGKNVGRCNETTPAQQAEAEAASQWERKSKKGYVQTVDEAARGAVDAQFITGGVEPMLAQSYAKHGHKIVWPAFVQPKLDGHRCIAVVQDHEVTLWSRTRKPITGVPHIAAALADLEDCVLDGELYHHDYRDNFEDLTSFIRSAVPKPGHEVVQYHVYDAVTGEPFSYRTERVAQACVDVNDRAVVFVSTLRVADADEAAEAFAQFVDQGYEGAILRNAASHYVGKRSFDLQKVKEFDDAEFEVIGVEAGRGRMADKAIFVCRTVDGTEFQVKMKGTLDSLRQYLADPSLAIGRQLTIQFQGYTGAAKVPRFPIGLRLREDV